MDLGGTQNDETFSFLKRKTFRYFLKNRIKEIFTNTRQTFEDSLRLWSECHKIYNEGKKVVPFGIVSVRDDGDRLE